MDEEILGLPQGEGHGSRGERILYITYVKH